MVGFFFNKRIKIQSVKELQNLFFSPVNLNRYLLHGLGTGRKKDKDFVNEILHSVDARFLSTVLYMLSSRISKTRNEKYV